MLDLLITNGCSLTKGTELANPDDEAWPSRLSSTFDVPFVNLARGGASNRRIVRSTIMLIESTRQTHNVPAKNTMVIIAWSQMARHEYYSSGGPDDQSGLLPVDLNWQRIGPWRINDRSKDKDRAAKAYYDRLWSEEGQMINFWLDWVLLDRYLKYHGYQSRYAFTFPLVDVISDNAHVLMDMIDGDTVWGGLPPSSSMSFLEMPSHLQKGPGGHPLTEGHDWFAERLAGWIRAGI